MTQTLKVLSLFCPQKFCKNLMGRCREPGPTQRCTGVRQEATDKFKYKKVRLDPRTKNWIPQSNCGLSVTREPQNWTGNGPKQPHPAGPALKRRLGLHGLPRSLQPAFSYDSMKLHFGCTMRQILLLFFLFNSIRIFICTDLPESLKTGRSFRSMLRIREVANRASFLLLVLMRTTKDVLSNQYWQHLSKSWFLSLKTWEKGAVLLKHCPLTLNSK